MFESSILQPDKLVMITRLLVEQQTDLMATSVIQQAIDYVMGVVCYPVA